MQIFMVESDDNYDHSNNTYYFVNEYGYFMFYQLGSLDLAFTVHKFDEKDNALSFKIDKCEYPKVYKLIKSMLDEIEKQKYLRGTHIITSEYKELYEKGYFSWKSDAPVSEYCNYIEELIYNFFNIHKGNDSYIFEFTCNIDAPYFTIELNTNRSRYRNLRFPVWDFFNKLKEICQKLDSNVEVREILKLYHNQKVKNKTNNAL